MEGSKIWGGQPLIYCIFLLLSSFLFRQKNGGGAWPPWPPISAAPVNNASVSRPLLSAHHAQALLWIRVVTVIVQMIPYFQTKKCWLEYLYMLVTKKWLHSLISIICFLSIIPNTYLPQRINSRDLELELGKKNGIYLADSQFFFRLLVSRWREVYRFCGIWGP